MAENLAEEVQELSSLLESSDLSQAQAIIRNTVTLQNLALTVNGLRTKVKAINEKYLSEIEQVSSQTILMTSQIATLEDKLQQYGYQSESLESLESQPSSTCICNSPPTTPDCKDISPSSPTENPFKTPVKSTVTTPNPLLLGTPTSPILNSKLNNFISEPEALLNTLKEPEEPKLNFNLKLSSEVCELHNSLYGNGTPEEPKIHYNGIISKFISPVEPNLNADSNILQTESGTPESPETAIKMVQLQSPKSPILLHKYKD